MCEKGNFFEECSCSSCSLVKSGTHPDLYIYEGSQLNIENIKGISEASGMTGLLSRWKIFVLIDAERLSNSGQAAAGNAFLKTLEEPGENSLFLLVTSKYDLILPTIRSRCSVVNFSPLNMEELKSIYTSKRKELYNDNILKMAGGSVERAFYIDDLKVDEIINMIEEHKHKEFIKYLSALSDTVLIKSVMEYIYIYSLETYKKDMQYKYILYGEYILEILQRFNYNINIELIKYDFISKTIEVFSERI